MLRSKFSNTSIRCFFFFNLDIIYYRTKFVLSICTYIIFSSYFHFFFFFKFIFSMIIELYKVQIRYLVRSRSVPNTRCTYVHAKRKYFTFTCSCMTRARSRTQISLYSRANRPRIVRQPNSSHVNNNVCASCISRARCSPFFV